MRKNTKLYKLLKVFYLNKNRKLTSEELADSTGINVHQISPYCFSIKNRVNKERINGKVYYSIIPSQVGYIGKKLMEAEEDEDGNILD